jgi:hypothetical protein
VLSIERLKMAHLFCALVRAKLVRAVAGVTAVAWICLNGCASSGFYQMSDGWCTQHPEASPARCYRKPYDVVQVGPQTYQASAVAAVAGGGVAGAQHTATVAANEKCKSLGKATTVTGVDTGDEAPPAGRAVVTFTCS